MDERVSKQSAAEEKPNVDRGDRDRKGNAEGERENGRYVLARSCAARNVRLHPGTPCNSFVGRELEDQDQARILEDLLNQRERLSRENNNWQQYGAVLKVLDEKLEETRLRLFYGPEFSANQWRKARANKESSVDSKRTTVEITIPQDCGGHQNLVGRLVGPSGSTIKQLERDLGCKISIRGSALKRNRAFPFGKHEANQSEERELYMLATVRPGAAASAHLEFVESALRHFVNNAVTTNADFDVLKKWQLIDLSKFRGQYRPGGRRSHKRISNDKTLNNAESLEPIALDKSVTFPAFQLPVRLVAVAPTMPYRQCFSTMELQHALHADVHTMPYAAPHSPPAEAFGAQQLPCTPASVTIATPPLTTPSSSSAASPGLPQSPPAVAMQPQPPCYAFGSTMLVPVSTFFATPQEAVARQQYFVDQSASAYVYYPGAFA